jgi:hypothetical protein
MTWHSISWHWCITMTSRNILTQLPIRIHAWVNCSRNSIYLKVLMASSIRVVSTLPVGQKQQ